MLCLNYEAYSKTIWKEIFGCKVVDVTINNVLLPRQPRKTITNSKLILLANKYKSIPNEYQWYYPKKVMKIVFYMNSMPFMIRSKEKKTHADIYFKNK